MWIYSNQPSDGAKLLAEEIGIRRIKTENSRFVGSPNKTVINWGCSRLPHNIIGSRIINRPESVAIAANKLDFFNRVRGVDGINIPDFTTDYNEAIRWIRDGNTVFARTVLSGHSGRGIVIMESSNIESLNTFAPLYTKYIKKVDEFRVHVVGDQVVDIQKKALRLDAVRETTNFKIRNLDNGFIYMREGVELSENVKNMCVLVISTVGLDFGAVDIIYNRRSNTYYVLEVNTAPGIMGTTVTNYANALREMR